MSATSSPVSLSKTSVPGGVYPANPDPVATFGVKATVVSRATVSADLVHIVVETLFENLEAFKAMVGPEPGSLEKVDLSTTNFEPRAL